MRTDFQNVLVEQDENVVTLTMNRPDVLNAINTLMLAEQMPGGEAAFGIMPFVGFRGTDIFNVSRQMTEQAVKQPPLLLKHYTNFMLEMGRVVTGQSTIEPDPKDKRFLDEVWKTNPFYHLYLQTYLTW